MSSSRGTTAASPPDMATAYNRAHVLVTASLLLATRLLSRRIALEHVDRILRGACAPLLWRGRWDMGSILGVVDEASRVWPALDHCLARAMVARAMLDWIGITAVLRIGVTKDQRALHAHAWLEHDGTPIFGAIGDLARFVPLPTRPR